MGHHNPKGCMAIRVGKEEEEDLQRFVLPIAYLDHPLFMDLLKEAEEEYGFQQEGVIKIPCSVGYFLEARDAIERSFSYGTTAHHLHHHRHHHRGDSHNHRHGMLQFHFTGCFGGGLKV